MNKEDEMEKYGYDPDENKDLDEVLKVFELAEEENMEEFRQKLLKDPMYEDHFSTVPQQQFLHIIFEKIGQSLRTYLKKRFGFYSTKLLFKTEASEIIEEFKPDYDDACREERGGRY